MSGILIRLELSLPLKDTDYKQVIVPMKALATLTATHKGQPIVKEVPIEIYVNGYDTTKAVVALTKTLELIKDPTRAVTLKLVGPAKEVDYLKTVCHYIKYWRNNGWCKKDGKTVLNKDQLVKLYAVLPEHIVVTV